MNLKILLTSLLLISCHLTYACKCGGPGTVQASFQYSDLIVHGVVVGKRRISFEDTIREDMIDKVRESLCEDQSVEIFESHYVFEIRLRVVESYKQPVDDVVTIYTTATGASCGYRFEIDGEYIVYGSRKSNSYLFFSKVGEIEGDLLKENAYWTNHCTRTVEYNSQEACALQNVNEVEYPRIR